MRAVRRPRMKPSGEGGCRQESIRNVHAMRLRETREISPRPSTDSRVDHHVGTRLQEFLGHFLLAGSNASKDFGPGNGAGVRADTTSFERVKLADRGITAPKCSNDDIGIEEDARYGPRSRRSLVPRRSCLTYSSGSLGMSSRS